MSNRSLLARCLVLWILATGVATASLVPAWQQPWPLVPSTSGLPMAGRELADGSTLVLTTGSVAVRYDANGSVLSTATFDPPHLIPVGFGRPGIPGDVVALGASGEIFISAATDAYDGDVWVMGYDGITGAPLWPHPEIVVRHWTYSLGLLLRSILLGPDGNPVLIGQFGNVGFPRPFIAKLDRLTGAPIWGPLFLEGTFGPAVLDSSGDVMLALAGATQDPFVTVPIVVKLRGTDGTFALGPVPLDYTVSGVDTSALEVDASGNLMARAYGNGHDVLAKFSGLTGARLWGPVSNLTGGAYGAIAVSPGGDLVSSVRSLSDITVAEYSGATGAVLWGPVTQPIGETQNEPYTWKFSSNGDPILAAWSTPDFVTWEQDVRRFAAADGHVVWGPKTIGGLAASGFRAPVLVVRSEDGALVSAAASSSTLEFGALSRDASTGDVTWGPTGYSVNAPSGRPVDIARAPDGTIYATGQGIPWLIHYDGMTGAVLWKIDLAPAGESPTHVRSDGSGNAIVTSVVGSYTVVVRKYAGSDGSPVWSASIPDAPVPVVDVNAAGDVALSWESISDQRAMKTAKLSGIDGAVLWGPVAYSLSSVVVPAAVAFSPGGDVIVGSYSFNVAVPQWVLLKYSSAAGLVQWGPIFVGSSSATGYDIRDLVVDSAGDFFVVGSAMLSDPFVTSWIATGKFSGATGNPIWGPSYPIYGEGRAGAVDSNGDLVVTGYGWGTTPDFATIKYRGSDGTTLWGPVLYDGPAGLDDQAFSLALDGAGNAIVAGISENVWDTLDFVLVEYDGSSGAPVDAPAFLGGWQGRGGIAHALFVHGSSVVVGTNLDRSVVAAFDETAGTYCDPAFPPPSATIAGRVTCEGQLVQLSASNYPGATYAWTGPNGFTSALREPTVVASAAAAGTYTVSIQAYGCPLPPASVELVFHPAVSAAISASLGTLTASVPDAGPGAAYFWTMSHGSITSGLGTPSIQFTTGPGGPPILYVTVESPTGCSSSSAMALFSDVAPGSPTAAFISRLVVDNVSTGCGPLTFCPNAEVTRAQMAVFLLRSKNGRYYAPPPATGTVFADVPANSFAAAWIEALSAAGITGGCGGGDYCPGDPVTRAQMAVLLLRTLHGSGFTPPPATGTVFADVPASSFAAAWIERLSAEGLTAGCGSGNFCPSATVSRAQMAVFLVSAFALP